ncbi:transposase [Deferrisoma camini]|uniref:transposase n=1 Tax=Deferrisoma camini TaxID=1035120 RepID=UPI00146C094E
MARGIDGYAIFRDERDREAFLERLAGVVERARADLLAWCLMSNHFHLLVRPREVLLAPMMRRLMTGYAGPRDAGPKRIWGIRDAGPREFGTLVLGNSGRWSKTNISCHSMATTVG